MVVSNATGAFSIAIRDSLLKVLSLKIAISFYFFPEISLGQLSDTRKNLKCVYVCV